MKQIQLTRGEVALVDDEDFDQLNSFRWHAHWDPSSSSFYARRITTEHDCVRAGKTISMHREIVQASSGQLVDHINHNTLDNQRGNLRLCSKSENAMNAVNRIDGSSKLKGVDWKSSSKKWRSRLHIDGKGIHLGYFSSPLDAARAYDAAALKYFGEFALTNESLGLLEVRI